MSTVSISLPSPSPSALSMSHPSLSNSWSYCFIIVYNCLALLSLYQSTSLEETNFPSLSHQRLPQALHVGVGLVNSPCCHHASPLQAAILFGLRGCILSVMSRRHHLSHADFLQSVLQFPLSLVSGCIAEAYYCLSFDPLWISKIVSHN